MGEPDTKALGPRELSTNFRALADATRLRILQSLWQRQGATVTDLCEELHVSQPLMSWHLRILRRAGLVTTQRAGRQVNCTVKQHIREEYGDLLADYLASDPGAYAVPVAKPTVASEVPVRNTVRNPAPVPPANSQ